MVKCAMWEMNESQVYRSSIDGFMSIISILAGVTTLNKTILRGNSMAISHIQCHVFKFIKMLFCLHNEPETTNEKSFPKN